MRCRRIPALLVALVMALSPLSPWQAIASAVAAAVSAAEHVAGGECGPAQVAPGDRADSREPPNLSRIGHHHERYPLAFTAPASPAPLVPPPRATRRVPTAALSRPRLRLPCPAASPRAPPPSSLAI